MRHRQHVTAALDHHQLPALRLPMQPLRHVQRDQSIVIWSWILPKMLLEGCGSPRQLLEAAHPSPEGLLFVGSWPAILHAEL